MEKGQVKVASFMDRSLRDLRIEIGNFLEEVVFVSAEYQADTHQGYYTALIFYTR